MLNNILDLIEKKNNKFYRLFCLRIAERCKVKNFLKDPNKHYYSLVIFLDVYFYKFKTITPGYYSSPTGLIRVSNDISGYDIKIGSLSSRKRWLNIYPQDYNISRSKADRLTHSILMHVPSSTQFEEASRLNNLINNL